MGGGPCSCWLAGVGSALARHGQWNCYAWSQLHLHLHAHLHTPPVCSGKDAGVVAGCRVTEGSIRGSLHYRVMRGGEVVHTGPCASLKRHKLEVRKGAGLEGLLLWLRRL